MRLRTFKNVRRRAEIRGEERGVTVIDDFAHHPTAVRETLRGLRNRYQSDVWLRCLSRVHGRLAWQYFRMNMPNAFAAADYVVIAERLRQSESV